MYNDYLNNDFNDYRQVNLKDYGDEPIVLNINSLAKKNDFYRTTIWTGKHLQMTLMSIPVKDSIGLEIHPNVDQFIRIESGVGLIEMGSNPNKLNYQRRVSTNEGIFIPAGTWHNLINLGTSPLKLYSIYAPINHKKGTVDKTKEDASIYDN